MEDINGFPYDFASYVQKVKQDRSISFNWKNFKKLLKIILYFFSLYIIFRAHRIINIVENNFDLYLIEFYVFISLLLLSVILIQLLVRDIFLPLDVLSENEKKEIFASGSFYYNKTFYKGSVGFGYFFIFAEFYLLVSESLSNFANTSNHTFIYTGLFFIVLGEIARLKGAILYLVYQFKKQKRNK